MISRVEGAFVTELEFQLLGPLEVTRGGEPVAIGGQLRRGVLAMLVLERGRVVSTDRLIAGVWGESPPDTVLTALHGHISNLRRALGNVIETRAPGYVLAAPGATVDVELLERRLDEGRAALASGDAAAAVRTLEKARALWRGAPLADIADLPFARDALPVLEELGLALREERMEAQLACGRGEEVVAELRALVAQNPLRERPRALLMLALFRAGRQSEALATYDDARRTLSQELGIEPGEPLRRLHESILREDPGLGAPGRAMPTSGPARPTVESSPRPSRRALSVAGAVGLGITAAVVVALGGDGGEARDAPLLRGAGILRVDPSGLDADAAIALDGTPTSVAAAGDVAWALDADGQTIAEVSGDKRVRTFATGATPTDVAAGASGLWVAQGAAGERDATATRTTSLAHVMSGASRVAGTVTLPGGGAAPGTPTSRIALTRGAVWVIAQDGRVVRVDPKRRRVVRVLDLRAQALAAEPERVWILSSDRTLLAVDDAGTVGVPIDAPSGFGASLTVGGGAVWVLDPGQGEVTRIDPGGSGPAQTARVGAGAGPVVYGHGSAWVVDGPRKRVVRLDGRSAAITGEVPTGGTPRDVAAGGRGVWITTGPRTDAAAAAGCGPIESGGRRPDVLIVVDLPLHGAPRRPTDAMAAAVGYVARRRGFRAGKLRIGYRVCDVSTAQLGEVDLEKCAAAARAYAADPRVVIEVGPYTSSCARRQLPIAAAARRGPVAMISPTTTFPGLTSDAAPRAGPRFYTRILARDDEQAAVMAAELRRRRDRRVFVLDDSAGSPTYGLDVASLFAAAARQAGLTVAGRTSFAGRDPVTVARRVARTRPDAIYLAGIDGGEAGQVIKALRRATPRATIAVPDLLTPVARLFETAGPAARGVLLTASALPVRAMPQRGRELASALARNQGVNAVHPYVVYSAQAADLAVDAIARSDGTRASVRRSLLATRLADGAVGPVAFDSRGDLVSAPVALFRLARGGGSQVVGATEGADLIAVRR